MGSKDIMEKHLESFNDVFSDMINVFIFQGNKVIKEEDLEDINPNSYFVEDTKIREQERDISKKWVKKGMILSFLGIENQTTIDAKMPFRVIGYDGVSYKYMLANDIPPCPVITIVLNFSMKRCTKHTTLLEDLKIDEELRPFVNDYKINIIDVAYLSRETIDRFQSDFKIIADYFVQMRETGEYKPMTEEVGHIWELLNLMSALTGDERFKIEYYREHRKERVSMRSALDKMISEGEAKGRTEGAEKEKLEIAISFLENTNNPIETIAKCTKLPITKVEELAQQHRAAQPV